MEYNTENVVKIKSAFRSGLDSDEVVAVHGTSLYTLQEILRTGIQPGYPKDVVHDVPLLCRRKGDVHMYPIASRTDVCGTQGQYAFDEAILEARGYATDISFEYSFVHELGGNFLNREGLSQDFDDFYLAARHGGDWESTSYGVYLLQEYGNAVRSILSSALSQKGVIIGYGKSVFARRTALASDEQFDVRVHNISIDDIVGVGLLDDISLGFLNSL